MSEPEKKEVTLANCSDEEFKEIVAATVKALEELESILTSLSKAVFAGPDQIDHEGMEASHTGLH